MSIIRNMFCKFKIVCFYLKVISCLLLVRKFRYKSLRRYVYSMSSKKKRKSPCSFASSKKPSKSKAFEFIRYIVRAGRKLKTKAKTNLQTQTHNSHGRTIVAGNRLQENIMNRQSLARKSRENSFLPVLPRGCDFVGEC